MSLERLQKFLAHAGIASRRSAESLITAGRVRVDGRIVTELGHKIDSSNARIEVDGRRIVRPPQVYLILHKPRGTVTTLHDPEGRPTVAALVSDCGQRVVPVGRLDYDTSGVLLMTNDGEFQAKLQHPSAGTRKIYHAKVKGLVDTAGLERWRRSIEIDGRSTRPATVDILDQQDDKTWISIELQEGRNRQVRRLGDQAGNPVLRLIRVEYAGLTVQGLRPGHWRHLTRQELLELKQRFGVPHRIVRTLPEEPNAHRRKSSRDGTPARGARPKSPAEPRTRQQTAAPTRGSAPRGRPPRSGKSARNRSAK